MSIQNNYYNLLMSGNDAAWTGTSWSMEYERVLESTNEHVRKQFASLDDEVLASLMALPTLFAYEKNVGAAAHVGRIVSINRRQREFGLTFSLDNAIAPILHETFIGLLPALDIDPKGWEVHRTHWAVKNVDLAEVLRGAGLVAGLSLEPSRRPPCVFISYSWDSLEHRQWVAQLATSLRQNGVEVILDQWHVARAWT